MDINTVAIIAVVVIVVIFVLFFLVGISSVKKDEEWKKQLRYKVDQISKGIQPNNEQSLKLSILEYDKLLDFALTNMNIRGNTLGEKLKVGKKAFPNKEVYEMAWRVHKLRNRIAHDVQLSVSVETMLSESRNFRKILERLAS